MRVTVAGVDPVSGILPVRHGVSYPRFVLLRRLHCLGRDMRHVKGFRETPLVTTAGSRGGR